LNELIGKAVISTSFQSGLMSSRRAEVLRQVDDLEPEERLALIDIHAERFWEFAAAVEQLIARREGRLPLPAPSEPAALAVPGLRWSSRVASSGLFPLHE
jgi:hypothetical protein